MLVATGIGKGCDSSVICLRFLYNKFVIFFFFSNLKYFYKNDKSSDQINHFWDLQLKRQNILAEFKLLEDRCKLLEKEQVRCLLYNILKFSCLVIQYFLISSNRTNWRTRCVLNRPNTFWMQRERP